MKKQLFTLIKVIVINFKKFLTFLKNVDYDEYTTENKVLNEINEILSKGPINNIKTKDDFIRFLFKTYFYKLKYRPFISYLEIIYRYYLIILVIILISISLIGGLYININNDYYKNLRIIITNVTFFSLFFYIPIRIYGYVRKILRNDIKRRLLRTILIGIIKLILFSTLISFTWFIGTFISSILNIIWVSILGLK